MSDALFTHFGFLAGKYDYEWSNIDSDRVNIDRLYHILFKYVRNIDDYENSKVSATFLAMTP
jgi:hypothetical protein